MASIYFSKCLYHISCAQYWHQTPLQEKCVEDWPEDSPELSPHFKPVRKQCNRCPLLFHLLLFQTTLSNDSLCFVLFFFLQVWNAATSSGIIKSKRNLLFYINNVCFSGKKQKNIRVKPLICLLGESRLGWRERWRSGRRWDEGSRSHSSATLRHSDLTALTAVCSPAEKRQQVQNVPPVQERLKGKEGSGAGSQLCVCVSVCVIF